MNPLDNKAEYDRRICKAIDFIHVHFKDELSIDAIARSATFSKFHFQRLFRATTGESVAEFVRRLRLETAARRLRVPNIEVDITDLAMELGFSSSQNFAKAFKNFFGVTATEYRSSTSVAERAAMPGQHAKDSNTHNSKRLDVTVTRLPEQTVAYKRHFGSYSDRGLEKTFETLTHWIVANELDGDAPLLGIPWDDMDVTEHERCHFDCCVVVPQGRSFRGINTQSIPAGSYAVLRHEVVQHNFEEPWDHLMRTWLPSSGLFPDDRPRFERYLTDGSDDPEGRWLVEFCLPVASA